jgi:hypothetical protein
MNKDWYIARGNKKYGPYDVDEIIQLRQSGKAFEHDLVWKQGQRQWVPLIQAEEFSAHAMALRVHQSEGTPLFNRRRWPRVRKELELLIHNDQQLWTGRSLHLSQGGALIELCAAALVPGDILHVHFRGRNESECHFSCEAVITGKRFAMERVRVNTPIRYAVRFEQLDTRAQEQLELWINEGLSEVSNNNLKGVSNVTANR